MKEVIRVGADPFPPYQYVNADGTLDGLDYRVVKAVLERAGYTPKITIDTWSKVWSCFLKGELDALFQVQDTPELLAKYFFSKRLRDAVTGAVTLKKELESLTSYKEIPEQNLSIAVIEGFSYGCQIDSLADTSKKTYPDTLGLLKAVETGEADLGIVDQGVYTHLKKQGKTGSFLTIPGLEYLRPLYVMFRESFDRDAFNSALENKRG
jgi:ABC-type amino acid transport substrate-binding protein